MFNSSKGLFGKMGNARQPLFVWVKRFSVPIGMKFSPMLTMDAKPEVMLKRPAE
jgi:hypothetical protein